MDQGEIGLDLKKITAKNMQTAVIKIPFSTIGDSLNSPALTALLNDGWKIFWCVPVEDSGPQLILLLKKDKNQNQENSSQLPLQKIQFFIKVLCGLLFLNSLVGILNIFI